MGSIGSLRPELLRAESRNRRAVLRPAAAQPLVAGVSRPGLLSRGGAAYAAQTPRWYPIDPSPLQRHHAPAVGILLTGYITSLMGLGRCPILSLVRRQGLHSGNPGSRQRCVHPAPAGSTPAGPASGGSRRRWAAPVPAPQADLPRSPAGCPARSLAVPTGSPAAGFSWLCLVMPDGSWRVQRSWHTSGLRNQE